MEKLINADVCSFEPAITTGEPFPLIHAIVGIHLAYSLMEKEVFWFAELSDAFSDLPNILKDKDLLSSGELVSRSLLI